MHILKYLSFINLSQRVTQIKSKLLNSGFVNFSFMATSALNNVILFLDSLGIYDVVLPFILVFSIVFAILEKSRILGTIQVGKDKFTNKNINSLVAFVIAFFVIASAQLVEIIAKVSSQMVILLLLSVFFLLLIGSFSKESEVSLEEGKPLRTLFILIMFLGIVFIFLNAIKTQSGVTWLEYAYMYLMQNISSAHVATVFLLIFMGGFVYAMTRSPSAKKESS